MEDLSRWIGRQTTQLETIEHGPLNRLNSLLEPRDPSQTSGTAVAISPCAHWLYFVPAVEQSKIDLDGHPKRGDFIPPLALPRRMWAKSTISYHDDIRVGDRIEKKATIHSIDKKSGKSGELVFLEIDNDYLRDGQLVRQERQTVVYRDHHPYQDALFSQMAEEKRDWSSEIALGATELFRYSAVTFNAHRIHYDSDYTRDVEGYPAIIVQGQLIATLVVSRALAAVGQARCKRFTFKAVKPIFSGQTFFVEGRQTAEGKISAWARQADGRINMTAEIDL